MKKLLLFLLLVVSDTLAQSPYDYLEIIVENGDSWVNVRSEPLNNGSSALDKKSIKIVDFLEFSKTEPSITRPEGFFLSSELEHWRDASSILSRSSFPGSQECLAVTNLAPSLACYLFNEKLVNLEREKFLRLWLSLTRAVVKNKYRGQKVDFSKKTREIARTGEMVWQAMEKSWTVEDVRVFSLHNPNGFSANLLVDAGGNIMTKFLIFPEAYYHRRNFSYDLVNKSSLKLKKFGSL